MTETRTPLRIATVIVRSLMGLVFVFASVAYFFDLVEQPPLEGALRTFNDGMDASVYLVPTVKAIELVCGVAFLAGRFVPLATVVIAPIVVNIFLVHAFLAPEGLPIAILLVAANVFLAYGLRDRYAPLLAP